APHKRAWYETFFIPREIELKLPVVVKLYPNPKGRGMNIKLWDLDWDHIEILTEDYKRFSDKVLQALAEIRDSWRAKESVIAEELPLPPQLLGLKMSLKEVTFSQAGQLVIFMNIDRKAVPIRFAENRGN
ncbi:MAG TPA: hypothetical protein PLU50_06960, partial [Pseudobdellovibrionaceae bacterium]|nr:hypothetical protein [Pseudobdellovibrionaceae bacterium]